MHPSVLWLNLALQNCRPATPLVVRLIANKNLAHGTGRVSIQRWHHGNRPQQLRSHGPQFTKDPYLKSGDSMQPSGGMPKSTPRRHHRECPYAHVCQGNFPNDASHDRRSKRVRACSSYGETIHDRRSSKACACMDKNLKIDRSSCP